MRGGHGGAGDSVDAETPPGGRILLSTHLDRDDEVIEGEIDLRGHEGVVVAFAPGA